MRLYLQETVTPAGMRWTVRFDGPEPDEQAVRSVAYRVFREAVRDGRGGRPRRGVLPVSSPPLFAIATPGLLTQSFSA